MKNTYDVDISFHAACTFMRADDLAEKFCGIWFTHGVNWLANTLKCYWLLYDIAVKTESFRKMNTVIHIKFATCPKKKTTEVHEGYLTFVDHRGFALEGAHYDACDLTIEDSKKCPLTFFMFYDLDKKAYVLSLPSEYINQHSFLTH